MKRHINEILKKGARLTPIKLDPNDPEINRLIEITIKEQEKVLTLKKIDYKLLEQRITI